MTQFTLKIIAMAAMLCDHFAKVILATGVLSPYLGTEGSLWLQTMLTVIGRIAMPIFAWFVAEGCRKSRNQRQYLCRLAIFAVLSEAPFQLCFWGAGQNGVQLGCHNVLFTLLFGAAAICAGQWMERGGTAKWIAWLVPSAAAVSLGWLLKTDYNAWGVALIIMLYLLPEKKQKLLLMGCWMTVFMLIWHGWNGRTLIWMSKNGYGLILQWIGGMFAVPLLACYQGMRGRKCRWLFYVFYPAHLWILYLFRCLI